MILKTKYNKTLEIGCKPVNYVFPHFNMFKFSNFQIFFLLVLISSCRVYSFTGAAIEGKTINVHFIENKARNVVPSLAATFTEKLRQRIAALGMRGSDEITVKCKEQKREG